MVTIDHIAEAAGVSKMTVSRILNGQTRGLRKGSAERAERIRAVALELGYRPHAAAVATARGRFDNIALVVGGTRASPGFGWLPEALLTSVAQSLAANDLSLSVADAPDDLLTDENLTPRILRHWAADGLLMNYIVHLPQYLVDLMDRHKVPTVWMNVKLDHDSVHPDDVAAGELATRHLIELGHRKIAYVGQCVAGGHYSEIDRLAGYRRVMNEAGLTCREITYEQSQVDHNPTDNGQAWLPRAGFPTAVVGYKYEDTIRMLMAAPYFEQYRSQRLSAISFSNEWSRKNVMLPMSAVHIPFREVGQCAVDMLLKKIRSPGEKLETKVVRPTLEPGDSTFTLR